MSKYTCYSYICYDEIANSPPLGKLPREYSHCSPTTKLWKRGKGSANHRLLSQFLIWKVWSEAGRRKCFNGSTRRGERRKRTKLKMRTAVGISDVKRQRSISLWNLYLELVEDVDSMSAIHRLGRDHEGDRLFVCCGLIFQLYCSVPSKFHTRRWSEEYWRWTSRHWRWPCWISWSSTYRTKRRWINWPRSRMSSTVSRSPNSSESWSVRNTCLFIQQKRLITKINIIIQN